MSSKGRSAARRAAVLLAALALAVGIARALQEPSALPGERPYGPPTLLGQLEDPAIDESSGLAASRTSPGLFWTHNDSGDGPFLYAFDREGRRRGVWRVDGASAFDWEDLAAGPGPEPGRPYLYVGDIGDNFRFRREIVVYRLPEPEIREADAASSRERPRPTARAAAIRLRYPDGRHDAEALLVHPTTGDLYIVTKAAGGAGVYRAAAPLSTAGVTTMAKVATLTIPEPAGGQGRLVTGGDIAPDGLRAALSTYVRGYELALPGPDAPFDTIWARPLAPVELGARRQGEAIAYRLDGEALLATSEGRRSPLYEAERRAAPDLP